MFQSTSFVARYAPAATAFSVERTMADVRYLTDSALNGRLSGSLDAERVAEWIAGEFEKLGLQPGGTDRTYFQPFADNYRDLTGTPTLTLRRADGQEIRAEYGRDFTRSVGQYDVGGAGKGEVVFVALKPGILWMPSDATSQLGLSAQEAARTDRVLLRLSEGSAEWLSYLGHSGLLTMSQHPLEGQRFELLAQSQRAVGEEKPSVLVNRSLVDRLLAASGHTVDELSAKLPLRPEDESIYLPTGWSAELTVPAEERRGVSVRNVVALWPGADVILDAELIVIAANYDGLGRLPDGMLYPGANDNASGVATMLETIRTLKERGFRPNRSILFVAWIGGERHRAVDYAYFLKAGFGFSEAYRIVAGLELEGVGAGPGSSAVIWHTARERLTEVVQRAARQVHTPLSTREQGLHTDGNLWPSPSASIPSATISWSGSDALAHTPQDTPDNLDSRKVGQVGRMVSLALMALASDPAY
jgi:hypothetical protein